MVGISSMHLLLLLLLLRGHVCTLRDPATLCCLCREDVYASHQGGHPSSYNGHL